MSSSRGTIAPAMAGSGVAGWSYASVVMTVPGSYSTSRETIVTDEQLAALVDRTARRTRDEVQVVVESLRGDIRLVADGVLRLTERQGGVEHSLEAVGGDVRELT